jgi:uncharacterized caspase-like protein
MRLAFGATLGLRALAIVVGISLIGAPALAAKRVALVIGNSAYRSVATLTNPANDSDDISAAFKRLGFSVHKIKDGTYDDMRRGLLEFNREVRGAEIGIVYYAGHGIEVGGENWLIPIDAELRSDLDVDHEAISLRSVLPALESASKLGLVILDACRNNPFAAKMQRTIRTRSVSRGLAEIEPTGNVLVAYSAKDGTTAADGDGRNSPFTLSLLKYIETPGLEINFLFRNVRDDVIAMTNREQQPFVYGSLSKEAIFFKTAPPPVAVAAPPPGPGPDEITWALIKDTSDAAAIARFIKEFPKTALRAQAEARVAALTAEAQKKALAPPPGPPPDELAWTFLKGTNDAAALRKFIEQFPGSVHRVEAEQRMSAITAEQTAAARAVEQRMAALAAEAQAAKTRPTGPAPEDVAWSLVKDSKDPNQFRLFLDRFPDSAHKDEAQQLMTALGAEQRAAALAVEQRMAALTAGAERAAPATPAIDNREMARSLQLELKRLGCFDGAVNGKFESTTRDALHNFAKLAAVNLPDDGLSSDTLKIIRGIDKRVCPLACRSGERANGERCIRIVCPSGQTLKGDSCVGKPEPEPKKRVTERPERPRPHPAAPAAAAPAARGGKCFSFNGRTFCE